MKKLLIFSIILCGLRTKAQTWVTIPDANFVTFLQGIVPNAMNGNQLNTTSTDVTNYSYQMSINYQNISNLFGIQYFTSITYLDCSYNILTTLPTLPNLIQNLDCSNNKITSLPSLPASLKYLECHDNLLTTLPTLPNSLTYLYCSNNKLTSIPPLASSCKGMYCDLYCDYNNLTSLPVLPDSLNQLVCNNNNITCFPTFPSSINRYSGPGNPAFSIDPNPYNCLPNYISAMSSTDLAKPICAAGNTNGCAVAGINQLADISSQINIYPNPAKNDFTIEVSNNIEHTIKLFDVNGKQVLSQTINSTTNINTDNLNAGVYNLNLISATGIANKRLVIIK
ncbi:MAG TPA: T9SS type A sorting domain-containing protein [Bacteroidia bacterium]|nr:T9SS type A sorting domain-containing protein [Bacteroidia bacterium]